MYAVTSRNNREVLQAAFSVGPLRGYITRPTELSSVQRVSAVQLRVHLWGVKQRATAAENSLPGNV
jgi:hypothetical protein